MAMACVFPMTSDMMTPVETDSSEGMSATGLFSRGVWWISKALMMSRRGRGSAEAARIKHRMAEGKAKSDAVFMVVFVASI